MHAHHASSYDNAVPPARMCVIENEVKRLTDKTREAGSQHPGVSIPILTSLVMSARHFLTLREV